MIKNIFPVIEGLDGSGKSAQAELLVSFLESIGKDVIRTKEQTADSEAGLKIKKILLGEITVDPLELQKLFVQDRKEHLENQIIPALEDGKFVVCERYATSTVAYGTSENLDIDLLVKMNDNFLLPDLTIILDVSPDSCIKRINFRNGKEELFEKKEKLSKAAKIYKKIPGIYENVYVVDGEKEIIGVFEEIKTIVEEKIL
ncbi:MAG: dTMP kinase [Candidatus Staskawiczbacteria bacterium]|nr:dTMP kinase [Candidatus Staskawiczbacteria bacterium]